MHQVNMFDELYPTFKIDKPIRLIELFAGIGFQAMALDYLEANYEHYKTIEFDKYAVASYNAIHTTNVITQDIKNVHGKDLEICDQDKYCYLLTYSFPCQDLSIAGKRKGMDKGSNTRSGLLWEVERLLDETDELPQVLLMENVPEVIGKKNLKNFHQWQAKLEQLGYSNYVSCLNAKNYGIPQNRNRCFMISILGNYYYEYPKMQPLKLRLKDMLEDEVDRKYFLSNNQIEYFERHSKECEEKGLGYRFKPTKGEGTARTCTCHASGLRMDDNFIKLDPKMIIEGELRGGKWKNTHDQCRRVYGVDGICQTITSICGGNQEPKIFQGIKIPEETKKGYDIAHEGDYVNLSYRKSVTRRGRIGKNISQTLLCSDNNGVVINEATILQRSHGYNNGGEMKLCPSITSNGFHENNVVKESIPSEASGIYLNDSERFHKGPLDGLSRTLKAQKHDAGIIENNFRIRKLTPRECGRLMGVSDENITKMLKVNSNSQCYKQFGNGIVVDVLVAIFKQLL